MADWCATTDFIDRVKSERSEIDDEPVYDLAAVRAAADHVIDLGSDAIQAVAHDGVSVSFAAFDLAYGPATQAGAVMSGAKLSLVFHGCGVSGLRELRHVYWGSDVKELGYLHSPSMKMITSAFAALKEWFDE